MRTRRHLLIMGCSQTKHASSAPLPAIERYDGSPYRVLRAYLRDNVWPEALSVAVLSARHGLMGGLTSIENYDQRMTADRAAELRPTSSATLSEWAKDHETVSISLGKDYLPALHLESLPQPRGALHVFEGGIGLKLHQIREFLVDLRTRRRERIEPDRSRMAYFLPDWDDMLDPRFDFKCDGFSAASRAERGDIHCCEVMHPKRICDGILVSLAQHVLSKGPLKRFDATDPTSLAPKPLRARFGLEDDQPLFGDCGAFSYVNEDVPTLSVDQAVALYELHGFDYGASVDHIPLLAIKRAGKKKKLSLAQRRGRVAITVENAQRFFDTWEARRCTFAPVGTIQALSPEEYGRHVEKYVDMGYQHLAIGGLVPLADPVVLKVADAVGAGLKKMRRKPWVHLFGVFRPRLQARFRELGIDSFDSATYFRKAWLRSDQNYLGTDGQWYAAIRVPMTNDPRTRNRLEASGQDIQVLAKLETKALDALHRFAADKLSLRATAEAVMRYDRTLARGDDHGENLISDYRRTLRAKPWKACSCNVCKQIGINALIFRGCNRNKRRGAHNTLMLFRMLREASTRRRT